MPIIKSAIKKVRVDLRRQAVNKRAKKSLKLAMDKARAGLNSKSIAEAARALAIAKKKNIIHRNKAARLLSRLTKSIKRTGKKG